jgi:hypothetical protein
MRGLLLVVTALAFVGMTTSAPAQQMQDMLHAGKAQSDRPGGAPPPQERPSKRANEKDYKSSLDRLPNQKYDPWAKTR